MAEAQHVITVDFARAAMAFAVMGYHLTSYEGIGTASRIGFYAVYAFFVISGFSLHIAYRDRMATLVDVRNYLIRRFFRIAPLFYTAIVLELLVGGGNLISLPSY